MSSDVDRFLADLEHPLKAGVEQLRAADFRFDDDSGLLDWVAPDRAVVTFRDLDVATRRVGGRRPHPALGRRLSQLVTSRRAKCRKASAVKIAE
jgi:hypothetical protein